MKTATLINEIITSLERKKCYLTNIYDKKKYLWIQSYFCKIKTK